MVQRELEKAFGPTKRVILPSKDNLCLDPQGLRQGNAFASLIDATERLIDRTERIFRAPDNQTAQSPFRLETTSALTRDEPRAEHRGFFARGRALEQPLLDG